MLKLFSILILVIAYVSITLGQATVNVQLSATDGTTTNSDLAVGLDLTATVGIDTHLGEGDLPPFPPAGAFEFRFDLTPYAGQALSSYKDYRNAPAFPFTGNVEHLMWYQRSAAGLAITITYNIPPNSVMRIRDQVGGVLLNLGPFTGSGSTAIPGSYPFTTALLLMEYTDVVPVELTSFTAVISGSDVHLNWTTATETNNRGFDIERKTSLTWETLGFVAGFGTTTEPKTYTFIDQNVSNGKYVYRLKQIDYDGTFEYSGEVELDVNTLPSEYVLFQNHPNPFNPSTSIEFAVPKQTQLKINVYNLMGELVSTIAEGTFESGFHQITFNAANLSTGTYIYRIESSDLTISKKMLLIK
jgi:hypothetical protein